MGTDAPVDAEGIAQRLGIVLRGRKPYSWGQAFGLSRGTIGRMLKGMLPTPDRLLPALRGENLSLTWLITGQGTPYLVHSPVSDAEGADLVRRLKREMGAPRFTVVTAPGKRVAVVLSEEVSKTDPDGNRYSYQHLEVIGGSALGHLTLDQVEHRATDRRVGMSVQDWERLASGQMSASELLAYKPKLHLVPVTYAPPGDSAPSMVASEAKSSYGNISAAERKLIDAWRNAPDATRRMVLKMLDAAQD